MGGFARGENKFCLNFSPLLNVRFIWVVERFLLEDLVGSFFIVVTVLYILAVLCAFRYGEWLCYFLGEQKSTVF